MPSGANIVEAEVCVICCDSLSAHPTHTITECNHTFHVSCIIHWLRHASDGSCPYCRGVTDSEYHCGWRAQDARYTFNRRFSHRKDAPKDLKNLVTKLQRQEKKRAEARKALSAWKKTREGKLFKELRAIHRKMSSRRGWGRWRAGRDLKAQIANYPVTPVPVPFAKRPRHS